MKTFLTYSILLSLILLISWKLFAILMVFYLVYQLVSFGSVKRHHPNRKE